MLFERSRRDGASGVATAVLAFPLVRCSVVGFSFLYIN